MSILVAIGSTPNQRYRFLNDFGPLVGTFWAPKWRQKLVKIVADFDEEKHLNRTAAERKHDAPEDARMCVLTGKYQCFLNLRIFEQVYKSYRFLAVMVSKMSPFYVKNVTNIMSKTASKFNLKKGPKKNQKRSQKAPTKPESDEERKAAFFFCCHEIASSSEFCWLLLVMLGPMVPPSFCI